MSDNGLLDMLGMRNIWENMEKRRYDPRLVQEDSFSDYGFVGDETPYEDVFGTPLYVGDVVEIFADGKRSLGDSFVVAKSGGAPSIMGICPSCDAKSGTIGDGFSILLKRSYRYVKPGEKHLTILRWGSCHA